MYNISIYSSTKITPYKALFGVKANNPQNVKDIVSKREALAASKRIKQIRIYREELKKHLLDAQATQKRYYNKGYIPKEFEIGDEVLLSIKNIWMKRIKKKLDYRWLRPFKVVRKTKGN